MSKQNLEQGALGTIGILGITLPTLENTAEFFVGITPIASFFLILVPTGIWAWFRAINYVTNFFSKRK